MTRVTVYHLTTLRRLPLIEEEGLRTRADLSERYGPPGPFDAAAPGQYAHGRRVSAYLDPAFARTAVGEHGPGLVSFTVDPAKVLAAPGHLRAGDASGYWQQARKLADVLAGGAATDDIEVHQPVPVRQKHLRLHAPLVTDEQLGDYAPLVAACADADRLSAKALMHLALIASDGDFDSPEFAAASAFAWRDEPDEPGLTRELMETDPDKVASAALAEYGGASPDATQRLRDALELVRQHAEEEGIEPRRAMFARSGIVLEDVADEGSSPTSPRPSAAGTG